MEIREDYVEETSPKEASMIGMLYLLLVYVLHIIVELMLMLSLC